MKDLLPVSGVILTILGTLMLYRYGLPGRLTSTGAPVLTFGPPPGSQEELQQTRQARRERMLSGVALMLIAAGSIVPALPSFNALWLLSH